MLSKARRLIGSRAFYAMVIGVVLPIIIQNAFTNFVSLLDNLMVGRIGTEQMSGVAIANQLIFVYNLAIFGAISGASIFAAQYHGAGNHEGVRASFRYKLYICTFISAAAIVLFAAAGSQLILRYLSDTSDPARAAATLDYARQYLRIMLFGLIPFALTQCYASTLRETGETRMPMTAGIIAVLVNLVFNYLLIYGKLGFPCLGVRGAAYATILSRYAELVIIAVYTHTHKNRHRFAEGLYSTMRIPADIVRRIILKGLPLLVNEPLWALSMAVLNRIYSLRGLDVVAAMNISSTVTNLFSVVFLSMGSASSIIIGQALGADETETAKDYASKLLAFSVFLAVIVLGVLVSLSGVIPLLYNTTESVHMLASKIILIGSFVMPLWSLINTAYFIIRSGGNTIVTFLFDSVFSWAVYIPLALALVHLTDLKIQYIYLCVQSTDLLKSTIGVILVQKGVWINKIVSDHTV